MTIFLFITFFLYTLWLRVYRLGSNLYLQIFRKLLC